MEKALNYIVPVCPDDYNYRRIEGERESPVRSQALSLFTAKQYQAIRPQDEVAKA